MNEVTRRYRPPTSSRSSKLMILQLLFTALLLQLGTLRVVQADEIQAVDRFIARYQCPVVDRLERIYGKGDPKKHPDEYLIIDVRGASEHYVQCLFFARGKLYCEAASGFYVSKIKSERTHLPQSAILALEQLGFSSDDSEGNFKIELDVRDKPDFVPIADLMLRALHAAYGANADTKLDFHAPYAPRETVKCIPVS